MVENKLKNPPGFEIDLDTLRAFERGLDSQNPEASVIPARVLGYGEISTVFAIERPEMEGIAFKRLPIFEKWAELSDYTKIYEEYNRLLTQAGLHVAAHGYAAFMSDTNHPLLYIIQQQERSDSIGHRAIHAISTDQLSILFESLLQELRKIWEFNQQQDNVRLGIDGQISNWAIREFDADNPQINALTPLVYLDTSTPLFRAQGVEQLNPELFLRSAPSFLRWLLRWLFLDDVLNRYYDVRLVVIDVLANFYKEQRPDLVPVMLEVANSFLCGEAAHLNIDPIQGKEVQDYYREDALIWSVYLSARRLDRGLHRILRRKYPYILPRITKR